MYWLGSSTLTVQALRKIAEECSFDSAETLRDAKAVPYNDLPRPELLADFSLAVEANKRRIIMYSARFVFSNILSNTEYVLKFLTSPVYYQRHRRRLYGCVVNAALVYAERSSLHYLFIDLGVPTTGCLHDWSAGLPIEDRQYLGKPFRAADPSHAGRAESR